MWGQGAVLVCLLRVCVRVVFVFGTGQFAGAGRRLERRCERQSRASGHKKPMRRGEEEERVGKEEDIRYVNGIGKNDPSGRLNWDEKF